jgi:hypothetical protein
VQTVAASHRPWVWEAERDGVKMYLAGCLHLGTPQEAAHFAAYEPYYRRAHAVYFEVRPGGWDSREIGFLVQRLGQIPSHGSIYSRISPTAWQELRETVGAQTPLFQRLNNMEPWYAALTLTQEGYRRAGLQAQYGLDRHLAALALEDGKPVGALEQPRDQVLAMADATRPDQERTLRAALASYRQPDMGTSAIRSAWRGGDLATLQKALDSDHAQRPGETHYNLLTRRNQQWVRKISSVAAGGKTALFVMGAEHLVTRPNGLPELLANAGFKVRRVPLVPEKWTGSGGAE